MGLFGGFSVVALLVVFQPSSTRGEETHSIFLLGATEAISCKSSYPPPWTKLFNGKVAIIGVNGKKHSSFNEPRYFFSSEGSFFSVTISDVRLSDAGNFICGSDTPLTVVVTVIR